MDPLWYKDALIYEVHVRAFADSNGDGIGDLVGLTERLPYLQDLGITCLWLLPFYPSPLRDDGYDIADYVSINPIYGTLDDFKRFLEQAHGRNIRVLTELVLNHTSDQHPWFQRARRATRGSPERDFYVWSDGDTRYAGTRVIFVDTEKSNWTLDPVAGQYYWHRFFSHQPDLNFDNPAVFDAVVDVMRFWLDLGVDALRLDAIPYLIEREGTINENLPETHDVLKRLRREMDARYEGRVLLAEANQWPSDVRAYFGDGDECHMCFHFPLMPRMFMALRQEERHPVVEIMNGSPEIPDTCQWAIFLRNHDELTLEMVTDEERDYMYAQYAADPQMRLNLGIRRRLAPLMENSRSRIELMNSLLFSMPGTPIIYYGDEIGMGDNVYLGDRNGVRTPMQWSSDRNAGFSRADPARLYYPVIMDPIYGYEAINVEAQERSPASLLHWMKRMIALRRQLKVFGRGSIEFIRTDNRKVLTYVRRHENQVVLCVANLARTVQPVSIPMAQFAGLTPVEMLGQAEFPRVTDQPYFLTLAPYGFYWFDLQEVVIPATARVAPALDEHAALPTFFAGVVWDSILEGGLRTLIERQALGPFLQRQRWFSGKARQFASARIVDWTALRRGRAPGLSRHRRRDASRRQHRQVRGAARHVERPGGRGRRTAVFIGDPRAHLRSAKGSPLRRPVRRWHLHDAAGKHPGGARVSDARGSPAGEQRWTEREPIPADALLPLIRGSSEQTNTSVMFDQQLVLKLFRHLEPGENPDIEIGQYLTARGFARIPALVGAIEYERPEDLASSVGMLQRYVWNQGNGWQVTVEEIGRYLDRSAALPPQTDSAEEVREWLQSGRSDLPAYAVEAISAYLATAEIIGRRTGEMHVELAAGTGTPAFAPEPMSAADIGRTVAAMQEHMEERLRLLQHSMTRLDDRRRHLASAVLGRTQDLRAQFEELLSVIDGGSRIRCHGDYHLGQVLVTEGDIAILDFEGEPSRPLAERRLKSSPLRDVAGMVRSFGYATFTALGAATMNRPEDLDRLTPWADLWERWVGAAFLRAYRTAARPAGVLPADPGDFDVVLRAYVLDKALYELGYELSHRPEWVHIPLIGLIRLAVDPPARVPPQGASPPLHA